MAGQEICGFAKGDIVRVKDTGVVGEVESLIQHVNPHIGNKEWSDFAEGDLVRVLSSGVIGKVHGFLASIDPASPRRKDMPFWGIHALVEVVFPLDHEGRHPDNAHLRMNQLQHVEFPTEPIPINQKPPKIAHDKAHAYISELLDEVKALRKIPRLSFDENCEISSTRGDNAVNRLHSILFVNHFESVPLTPKRDIVTLRGEGAIDDSR